MRRDPSRESSIFRHPRLCLVLLADVGEIPGYHRGAVLTLTLDSGRSVYSVSLRRSARLQWIFSSELPRSRAHIPHRMSRFRAFGDSSMGKEHHADQSRVEGNGHLAYKINDLRHCDVPCSACVLFRFGSLFHSAYFLTTTLCLAVVCIAIRLSWRSRPFSTHVPFWRMPSSSPVRAAGVIFCCRTKRFIVRSMNLELRPSEEAP